MELALEKTKGSSKKINILVQWDQPRTNSTWRYRITPHGKIEDGSMLIEGSILRVYYSKDEWHISTNGRLDAFTSFWANPESFGKQFENLIFTLTREQLDFDEFCCGLDQEYNYFFLLPTFENNRLGALEDIMKFYLVGLEHTKDHTLLSGSSLPSYTRGFTNHQLWSYPSRITKEQAFREGAIAFSSIT
jgi:hypothetical protein